MRILLIVYFLETGLVLLLAPWSIVWERNLFVELSPLWRSMARLHGVRGAVSGLGLVSLGIGVRELMVLIGAAMRRRREAEADPPPAAAGDRTLAEEAGSWLRKP